MQTNKLIVLFADGRVDVYPQNANPGHRPEKSDDCVDLSDLHEFLLDYEKPIVVSGLSADDWRHGPR